MKMIVSIIGTRPQYIKLKPIDEYCKRNNIKHVSIDTNQHYSDSVSKNIKNNINLKIDINLLRGNQALSEIDFISKVSLGLSDELSSLSKKYNIFCLIYGDTNSSFAAALACYKLKVPFAHIEAGARCFNNKVPEEVNRIFVDSASDLNFCTSKRSLKNIKGGVLSGDLEYELLNSLDIQCGDGNYTMMTLHRQSNMQEDRLRKIFGFCEKLERVVLPIHHRLKNNPYFDRITIPANVEIVEPMTFTDMASALGSCKNIISDSGGVLKTAPFFGKKILVLRKDFGWTEVMERGYARVCEFSAEDLSWFDKPGASRAIDFYIFEKNPSEIIINESLRAF